MTRKSGSFRAVKEGKSGVRTLFVEHRQECDARRNLADDSLDLGVNFLLRFLRLLRLLRDRRLLAERVARVVGSSEDSLTGNLIRREK